MSRFARIASVGVTGLVALWLAARFLVWEPDGLERGSLLYFLKVPARAKEWPLWRPDGAVLYDFRHADGEARGYTNVRYRTSLSIPALRDTLMSNGYGCTEATPLEIVCDLKQGDGHVAQVTAEQDVNRGLSDVTVSVFAE